MVVVGSLLVDSRPGVGEPADSSGLTRQALGRFTGTATRSPTQRIATPALKARTPWVSIDSVSQVEVWSRYLEPELWHDSGAVTWRQAKPAEASALVWVGFESKSTEASLQVPPAVTVALAFKLGSLKTRNQRTDCS
jgi:hypothetical protein